VLDAKGLVIAPGFIDLHQHALTPADMILKAQDGVTTAAELEVGTADVDAWYGVREGRMAINFAVSVGHIPCRMAVIGDLPAFLPAANSGAATRVANDEQLAALRAKIEHGLRRGAVAVGFGLQYTPGATQWESLEIFRVAARFRAESIPLDAIWLDIQHHRGFRSFTVDEAKFPPAMFARLRAAGVKVVAIADPGLKIDPAWDVYQQGEAGGHFLAFEGNGRVTEYIGGYNDYLRQARSSVVASSAAPSPKAQLPTPKKSIGEGSGRKKLSYNESRELADLPERIETLEAEIAALRAESESDDFYKAGADRIKEVLARIETAGRELESTLARWMELEERN
jgi:hypothetical protein